MVRCILAQASLDLEYWHHLLVAAVEEDAEADAEAIVEAAWSPAFRLSGQSGDSDAGDGVDDSTRLPVAPCHQPWQPD